MSKTSDNLKQAFAGESKANRRYLAFAQKAEEEGYPQVAKLFRAIAEAETIHALNHLGILGEIKSTEGNLKTAISGENFEFKGMYPEYLNTARQEGQKKAAWNFEVAGKVEKIHAGLFSKAIKDLKSGARVAEVEYHICSVCGYTVEGATPEKCPICGAPKEKFFKAA